MTIESNEEKKYPISEWFVSPQGEGVWAGACMFFLRLAGCTVGKPYPKEMYKNNYLAHTAAQIVALPIYTEQCTLFDGRKFACDTDYRKKEMLTSHQIMQEIPKKVKHVCITGGEPMMHNLDNLISYLWGEDKVIHLETSGTIDKYLKGDIWVTVSPKFNPYYDMIRRANELKILVDKDFHPEIPMTTLSDGMVQAVNLVELAETKPIYLQPINGEFEVNKDNLQLCLDIQQEFPAFRVSVQLHKVMSAVTEELIR